MYYLFLKNEIYHSSLISCFDGKTYIYSKDYESPIYSYENNIFKTNGDAKFIPESLTKLCNEMTNDNNENNLNFFTSDGENNIQLMQVCLEYNLLFKISIMMKIKTQK